MSAGRQEHGSNEPAPSFTIRRATPADAGVCGTICYEAFREIAERHNFPSDFPSPQAAADLLSSKFSHPGFFCVVAEQDGKIIGSNCLDERASIAGLGPITVDPAAQNRTAGRQLMRALIRRAAGQNLAGVRLIQSGYHNRSLSLYTKLGFTVQEPLACLHGVAMKKSLPGYRVRMAQAEDFDACNALCQFVHKHTRSGELLDAIRQGAAVVAESGGQITGYSSGIGFSGHAVGKTNEDLQAMIAEAAAFSGPGFLVPTRNTGLFRWCLENGLRVVQPMMLMTMGLYSRPTGAYLPSCSF